MPPGEEDNVEFVGDIAICHVEVVFEGGEADEAAELVSLASMSESFSAISRMETHILLHVLLPGIHGTLAHLESQLCCRIVDEAAKRGVHVVPPGSLLGWCPSLLVISISALRLGGWMWWGR